MVLEGWSFGDAVYFALVTGLTIAYGDLVPRQAFARALAAWTAIQRAPSHCVRAPPSLVFGSAFQWLGLSSHVAVFTGHVNHADGPLAPKIARRRQSAARSLPTTSAAYAFPSAISGRRPR